MQKSLISYFKKIKKKNRLKSLNLHEPIIGIDEINEVSKCLKLNYVSSSGPQTLLFEQKLKNFTKSKYVICVNSGTSAIHIALIASGVKKNEEVLVPSLTFVGTINPILYLNAIPHFVDTEKKSLGIDFDKLEKYLNHITIKKGNYYYNKNTNRKITAIIPVHVFGHPVNIEKLKKIVKKFRLKVVEDAAESLGSLYKNRHVGTFGDFGVLSFNGNKIITTGSGGAILTNNYHLFKKALHISSTSKLKKSWEFIHDKTGYNYRLASLNASLGLAQLKKIKKILSYKRKLNKEYKKIFKYNYNFKILSEPENCKSNYWLQTLIFNKKQNLNKILKYANNNKIQFRPVWRLMHRLIFLKKYPKMNLNNSISFESRIISLPSGNIFKF